MKDKIQIGIIGGKGAMGSFFYKFFKDKNFTVLVSDLKTKISNKEIAKTCNIVFLSLPLNKTIPIIKEIAPLLSKDQLLSDFSSLKEDILKTMLVHSKASVIGCHPLFGPNTKKLNEKNLILCPARDNNNWIKILKNQIFKTKGLQITITDAKTHDQNMAVVQGLNYLILISLGEFLKKRNLKIQDLTNFSTPVFNLNLNLIGRLFGQDLSLYFSLINQNKYLKEVLKDFKDSFNLSEKFLLKDNENKFLEEIKVFLKDFPKKALKETNKILK